MENTQSSANKRDRQKVLSTESQNYQESLENIIKERTAQLEQAIADLERKNQELLKAEDSLRTSQDQLEQQQEFFRLVIDSNPNLIFIKDWDGRYLLANQTMAKFYNTTVENLVGKTDTDFHPNTMDAERFLEENRQIISSQQDMFLPEEKISHVDLGSQWLQWQKRPIKIFGNIDGVLGVGVNITSRKQIEISLSESQQRFESLAAVAPVGIYRTNTTGDAIYLNDRWCEIAGLTAAEASGPNWSRALHPDDREKVGAEWYASVQERRPFELECRFQKPDGTITWVLSRASAERDIYGEIIGYVGTITDISDRKRAESVLQKLVTGTAAVTGTDFFMELVRHIAEALDVCYAIATEFVDDHLISLAFWANGSLQDPISYVPARTPCEIALREGEYHCDQSVQQIFVEDLDLVTMQAESYLGISLKDDCGSAIGNLCILDTKSIPKSKRDEAIAILQVFAARASAELQRKNANEALNRLNQELEMRVQQRTQELQERERFLQTVLDSFPLAVFWKNRQSAYLGCNQLFAKISGVESPLQTIGKTNFDFSYTEEEAQKYLEDDQTVMDSGISKIGLEETITLANGEVNWIETNKIPLRNELGEVVGVVGTFQDISDRKQAEAKLHQLNEELIRATRLKDEFLANMSHELRTPLNAILGMTEGLLDGIFGDVNEQQIKFLRIIERSGTHLLSLINDILDVAKIESGKITLDLKATSVQYLCQSSISFIKQEALNKRIQIVEKVPKFLPEIMLDERRIRQVLINLLNNAVKFTPEGGSITLEVAQISVASSVRDSSAIALDSRNTSRNTSRNNLQYLKFAITDTGIGISDENIQKLFQPFIQIDSALNRQYNGTGLGLALVKRLVELHGGWVELTSKIGVGSCFALVLPYDNAALVTLHNQVGETLANEQESPTDLAPSSHLQDRLILLAEDNQANVITISSYLTAKGYRILLAEDGQEAVCLAKLHLPDIILMDLQMPIMDGLTAIQQIRLDHTLSKIPIIAVTALAMEGDREKCLAAGANDYLSKPIRLKSLAEMIDSYFTN
jgi:PAS domain S-box-containing protein